MSAGSDLDLLSGSSEGGVQWAENRAGPGKAPQLELFRPLIKHGPQANYGQILRDEDLKEPLSCTRIWVDDVNSDGKLDILVGGQAHLVSPVGQLTEGEFRKKLADWNKSIGEATREMNSEGNDGRKRSEARIHYQELYKQRSEFMKDDRTGFVWLYLRK